MSDETRLVLLLEPRGAEELPFETPRVLAAALGIPLADAALRLRRQKGLLASGLRDAEASALESSLARLGVATRRVEEGAWALCPRPISVSSVALEKAGLRVRLGSGRALEAPWPTIRAVHLFVEAAAADRPATAGEGGGEAVAEGPSAGARNGVLSPRAQELLRKAAERDGASLDLRLHLHTQGAAPILALQRQQLDYAGVGSPHLPHSLDRYLQLVEDILDRLPHAWNAEAALEFLRSLDTAAILCTREEAIHRDRWIHSLLESGDPALGSAKEAP